MRILLIALTILLFATVASSQEQTGTFANPISRREVLELPRRDVPPKLGMQRALKVAERFIKKERIDISSCYLFEAIFVSDDVNGDAWRFWWVRTNRASPNDVKLAVSMDRKARRL